MKRSIKCIGLMIMAIATVLSANSGIVVKATNEQVYYFDELHKVDRNEGFTLKEEEPIDEDDVHFGWKLGSLYVKGFTMRTEDGEGNQIFLKNVGDKLKLGFESKQKISKLNNDDSLEIAYGKKGFDLDYGIKKTEFGKGVLIIKHTDYQNKDKGTQKHLNYFSAKSKKNANNTIDLKEEGDYEVVLDYTIKSNPRKVLGISIMPMYYDYTIRTFKFSVRNGNSMEFILDLKTGKELQDKSFTEQGFRIDLAKSRYLKVYVKREKMDSSGKKDVIENKPAKDGAEYTAEGLYTVTVENPSTGQTTSKQIYVGQDKKMKAYVTTGKSINEIEKDLQSGATISEDGIIEDTDQQKIELGQDETGGATLGLGGLVTIVVSLLVLMFGIIIFKKSRRNSK